MNISFYIRKLHLQQCSNRHLLAELLPLQETVIWLIEENRQSKIKFSALAIAKDNTIQGALTAPGNVPDNRLYKALVPTVFSTDM